MKLVIADAKLGKFEREVVSSLKAQFQSSAAQVRLRGIPPFSHMSLRAQLLTGLSPEWTGVFDEYKIKDYRILLTESSQEAKRRVLWRMAEAMGKRITLLEDELPTSLSDLVYSQIETPYDIENLCNIPDEETVKMLILPEPSERPCKRVNINDFFDDKGLVERRDDGSINWEETLAYHVGHGQIWINLLGREPKGVVSPGKEYLEVREALTRILADQFLDNETGDSIIRTVWRKEDIYNEEGKFFIDAPDLIVTFLPGYWPSSQSVRLGFGTADQERVAEHSSYPANDHHLLVWGNSIKSEYSGDGRLVDLVPTALYILGLPIPQALNGSVLEEIFEPGFVNSMQPRYQAESGLTPQEEALLVDRLGALGYLE
jgi:predicted AlkP superfamily phosphohydrolase/phosphomutase